MDLFIVKICISIDIFSILPVKKKTKSKRLKEANNNKSTRGRERERERMENIWVSFDQTVIASECINLSRKRKRKQESESKAQHFICLNASVCAIYALHLVAIHFPNTSLDAFCRSFVWTLLLPIPWWIERLNSMVSRIIIIIIIIAANEDEIRM